MYYGSLVSLNYWRNFVPYAPQITVNVRTGEPFPVDLSEWLLQGARDPEDHTSPDEEVLSRVPVQRGWRLNPIISEQPAHGFAEVDRPNNSIVYTSVPGYLGEDCMTYRLTNGTQRSLMAQILFNVDRFYGVDFVNLEKKDNGDGVDPTYNVDITFYQPSAEPVPLFIEYFWYYENYKVVKNISGIDRVFTEDYLIQKTGYVSDNTTGNYPKTSFAAKSLDGFTAKNDSNVRGLVEYSDIPYRPTGEPYQIKVKARLYFDHKTRKTFSGTYTDGVPNYYDRKVGLDFSQYSDFDLSISNNYGPTWWKSGNIIEI